MINSYTIYYSPAALDDLRNIYIYISEKLHAPENAEHQINRIRFSIKKLTVLPKRHELVTWKPWHSQSVYRLPVDNYIIFYQVNEPAASVLIVRIFYGGRNVEEIITDRN